MARTANLKKYFAIRDMINKNYPQSEIVRELSCSYTTIQSAILWLKNEDKNASDDRYKIILYRRKGRWNKK